MQNTGKKCTEDSPSVDSVMLIKAPVLDSNNRILKIRGNFVKCYDVPVGSSESKAARDIAILIAQLRGGLRRGDRDSIDGRRRGNQPSQKEQKEQRKDAKGNGDAGQDFAPGKRP